jgi:hypothetical protein
MFVKRASVIHLIYSGQQHFFIKLFILFHEKITLNVMRLFSICVSLKRKKVRKEIKRTSLYHFPFKLQDERYDNGEKVACFWVPEVTAIKL